MAKPTTSEKPKAEQHGNVAPASESQTMPEDGADSVNAATAPSASPPAEQAEAPRFRVWKHGALAHDGTMYSAGEELALTEAEVAQLNCPAIERF